MSAHEIEIHDELPNGKFTHRAECKCGWVGRGRNAREAVQLGEGHLCNQGYLQATEGMRQGGL